MSGSNQIRHNGNYGVQGIPNESNMPSCRENALGWTDLNGNLWLFGGVNSGKTKDYSNMNFFVGFLNDLWMYDGGNWTWISGNSLADEQGSYGEKGAPLPTNVPGARYSATGWRDNDGNLWMFGGFGYGESSSIGMSQTHFLESKAAHFIITFIVVGRLNDVWRYENDILIFIGTTGKMLCPF
jgi:hypothetical protein